MWHSLEKDGSIKVYDIYWFEKGTVEHNIPSELLEGIKENNHKNEGHGEQSPETPVKERKKKAMPSGMIATMGPGMSVNVSEGKSEMKLDQEALRRIILEELALAASEKKKRKKTKSDPRKDFLYPYAYGVGRRRDYEEDEEDIQLDDYIFGDGGDIGGGGEGGGGE